MPSTLRPGRLVTMDSLQRCEYKHLRVHTEWQRLLSGVHFIMMEKLAQAGMGGGCTPTPLTIATITYKVAVYAPAEWAETLTIFHLYQ
jgi:hypothetical protein